MGLELASPSRTFLILARHAASYRAAGKIPETFDFVETVGQQLFASGQEQLDSSDSFVKQGYHSR